MRSLVILFLIVAFKANVELSANSLRPCPKKCDLDYTPICAVRFGGKATGVCTFPNMCVLQLYVCHSNEEWHIESGEPCQWPTDDCSFIMTFYRNNKDLFILNK